MFFKKFDRISPLISLSFKGENMHSSILSGILSILAYSFTIVFGIYYFLEFILKEKPSAYFFTRFIQDAGKLTLNTSSLFHYLYLLDKTSHSIVSFDLDMIRVVGLNSINIESYYSSTNLELIPHWIYGLCKNEIKENDIGDLIENNEEFEKSVCISKYYNPNTKKYYNTNDNNFIWPSIEHGMSSPDYSFYGIIIEKCKDENLRKLSGLNNCKNNDIIDKYVYSKGIVLEIIDHYSDVLNYKEPFTKYFYSISNLLFPKSYTINNLNFNPALLKTHNGIILDNVVEEKSYLFSQNEKVTMDEAIEEKDEEGRPKIDQNGEKIYKSTGIISSYYFFLQNRLQLYDRNYKRLQDILSNIGGLSRTFFFIANIINAFVSNYITLSDTEQLLLSIDNTNYYNEKIINQKSYIIHNKENNEKDKTMFPPKRNNNNRINFQQLSNNQRLTKDGDTISENRNLEETAQQKHNLLASKKNSNNSSNFNNKEEAKIEVNETKNIEIKFESKNYNKSRNLELKDDNKEKEFLGNQPINKLLNESKKEEINNQNKRQKYFNWFDYIFFTFHCGRNNPIISYYKNYRNKVISEENFIRGQLDIFRLEKIFKVE